MKDVQCYELFGGIAPKNHAFSFVNRHSARAVLLHISGETQLNHFLNFDVNFVTQFFIIKNNNPIYMEES